MFETAGVRQRTESTTASAHPEDFWHSEPTAHSARSGSDQIIQDKPCT